MDPSRQAWLMSKPVGITSEASSVLGLNMSVNPGASVPASGLLPVLPAAPQPALPLFWEPPAPFMTVGVSPGNPLLLSALPGMSLVAGGDVGCGLSTVMPLNIVQFGTPGRTTQTVYKANTVLTQAPLNCSVPGTLARGVECPAQYLMTIPTSNTFMYVPAAASAHPQEGTWVLGPHPPAPFPVVQLVPTGSPVNAAPPSQGAYGEGSPANLQANPIENCLSKPDSVYGNFRRWQHIKTLVHRHLPLTPDVEAFSCFLIPVLRSLARRKPTMYVEEGLWRGLQEWQCTSNFDRMIFHEMANKFTEFESTEEMENPGLEMIKGFQRQASAPPLTQDRPRPQAPEVNEKTVCVSTKTGPKTNPPHLPAPREQQTSESKAPVEIPPEAIQEYMDIMDWLEGLPQSVTGTPGEKEEEGSNESEQEGDDLYLDPGLLNYIDELCSQEDFVKQVEAIISPRFVTEILSRKPEVDMLTLIKELEQEEGLAIDQVEDTGVDKNGWVWSTGLEESSMAAGRAYVSQLLEKHHLTLRKKRGETAPMNPGAPEIASSALLLTVGQGAKRDDNGPQRGLSAQTCSSQKPSLDHQCHRATDIEMLGPKPIANLLESQGSPLLEDTQPTSVIHGQGNHSQGLGSRCAVGLKGASPTEGPHESVSRTNEDKEELPSLSFLLSSQHQLVPWKLSHYLDPYAGLPDPGDASQPPSPKRSSLSPDPPVLAKKRALIGGLAPVAKMPSLGPCPGVSEALSLPLELVCLSQPQKRKCESLGTQRRKRKKRH